MKILNKFGTFLALIWVGAFATSACAQIVDSIIVKPVKDKVIAIIRLNAPVQYLRHFPPHRGQHLEIFYNILDVGAPGNPELDNTPIASPRSDLIPSFTVEALDQNVKPKLVIEFSRPAEYQVFLGKTKRSFVIFITPDKSAAPAEKGSSEPLKESNNDIEKEIAGLTAETKTPDSTKGAQAAPAPTPTAATESSTPAATESSLADKIRQTDNQADALMAQGYTALKAKENDQAIEAFNKVLQLPPNKDTQDAQEWIGVARELAGQKLKAKLEYELYLKMYPTGEAAARVNARLAKLADVQYPTTRPSEVPQVKTPPQTITYGSLSAYYYHGASRVDTSTIVGFVPVPTSLTLVDQSMLISNVNMGTIYRSDEYDNRLVFQDSYSKNFLADKASINKLGAAYFDFKNRVKDYSVRVGRQSPTGGGVMGRFDGANLGYGFSKLHVNAVAGRLVDFSTGSNPIFYGASLDTGTFNQRWGGSLYVINQTVDNINDRRAVGADMRYFEQNKNVFATLDYDTTFSVVNMALLQGTLNAGAETSYNFLVDHRKTPSLSTRVALNGATTSSLKDLLNAGFTLADLKTLAKARTADANLAQIGFSHQITEKLQLSTDLRVSSTSGMPASGTPPDPLTGLTNIDGYQAASAGTGNQWALTPQLIGIGLFSSRDVSVMSVTLTTGRTIKGESFFITHHAPVSDKWTADASLRLYRQTDNLGGSQTITTPTIKASYRVREKISLDLEGGLEINNSQPATGQPSKTNRKYFSLGVRGDY